MGKYACSDYLGSDANQGDTTHGPHWWCGQSKKLTGVRGREEASPGQRMKKEKARRIR